MKKIFREYWGCHLSCGTRYFPSKEKAGNDLFTLKILFKTDFSYTLLVTKNKIAYPMDVPHLGIFVPHSKPEQMATLDGGWEPLKTFPIVGRNGRIFFREIGDGDGSAAQFIPLTRRNLYQFIYAFIRFLMPIFYRDNRIFRWFISSPMDDTIFRENLKILHFAASFFNVLKLAWKSVRWNEVFWDFFEKRCHR